LEEVGGILGREFYAKEVLELFILEKISGFTFTDLTTSSRF